MVHSMDCGLVRAMTPVPKPRAITSVAGAIPVQWSVSVAIREDQTSGLCCGTG
ncbi:hypothetical protein ACW4TU_09030 [Streptomyces sp. QTS52]